MSSKLHAISRQFAPYLWPWYGMGVIFFILNLALVLTVPRLTQTFIDGFQKEPTSILSTLALWIIAVGCIITFTRTASRLCLLGTGRLVETGLRDTYFLRCLRLAVAGLEKFPVGDLISRMTSDMRQIGFFYGFGITQLINFSLTFLFVLSQMLRIHPTLALSVTVPILVNVVVIRFIVPKIFMYSKLMQQKNAALAGEISEAFHHIQTLKWEGATGPFFDTICQRSAELFHIQLRYSAIRSLMLPLFDLFSSFSYVIVFFYGGWLVLQEDLSVGGLAAFGSYVTLMGLSLFGIGLFIAVRQRALAASERLKELDALPVEHPAPHTLQALEHTLTTRPVQPLWRKVRHAPLHPLPAPANASSPAHLQTLIRLTDLSFAYPGHENVPILRSVNLSLAKGEHVAVVGEIGCGKTTLQKILMGLYPPSSGTYEFLGQDARTRSAAYLRQHMGWVTQEAHFFSESIAFNLALGEPKSEEELHTKMVQATKDACIYDEIMDFPHGFESKIGENGLRLSGGQKQRLALARMFMRTKQIYLLDDVFSALDHATEEALIHNLARMDVSLIIVSHRPSVLKFCHRTASLEGGALRFLGAPAPIAPINNAP